MKLIRVLFTVIIALLLFPTIFLTIQSTIISKTIYSEDFATYIHDDYNLSNVMATSVIHDAPALLEHFSTVTLNDFNSELITTLLNSSTIKNSLSHTFEPLYYGVYNYYFKNATTLPTITFDYLGEIFHLLPINFSTEIDLNSEVKSLYNHAVNPITQFTTITYEIPRKIVLLLIVSGLLLTLMYFLINGYHILPTLQFVVLIGMLASFFNLLLYLFFNWFSPSNQWLDSFRHVHWFSLDTISDFFIYTVTIYLAQGVKITLFILILFIIILSVTEVFKYYKKQTTTTDSWKTTAIQIGATTLVAFILILFFVTQTHLIRNDFDSYSAIYHKYEHINLSK